MQPINLFPTTIYKEFINENMKKDLLNLCEKYTQETETNLLHISNFPSTLANKDLQNQVNSEPVVKMVFNYLLDQVQDILHKRNELVDYNNFNPYGFFSSMQQGAYLRQHSHKDCKFSGIIYLEVGDDVPGLIFHDPRPFTKFISSNNEQNSMFIIEPEEKMLLIWDSWLDHEVMTKNNQQPRKSFTFNL